MPSHKSKKSSSARSSMEKSKETDLKPLMEYVDDRVELIRHAFMCLKPKTIKNIAPEFLKGKSIEKLQEICLDEVLGLSTKRLLSIINATVCPSDTESSDSDAPKVIEDHISLSEISSDDDMLEEINSKKVKKLHKKRTIKKEKDSEGKKKMKNGQSEASTSKSGTTGGENKMSEKEMTVLELLELQARARAIRSQLALEPVTKIELDSDDSTGEKDKNSTKPDDVANTNKEKENDVREKTNETSKEKEKSKSSTKKSKSSSSKDPESSKESENRSKEKESRPSSSKDHSSGTDERAKSDKRKQTKRSSRSRSKEKSPVLDLRAKIEQRRNQNQSVSDKTQESNDKPRRRVVLKRNFGSHVTPTTENSNTNDEKNTTDDTAGQEKVKQERESDRESSPDVIAMHPSPETILLTSSDEEGDGNASRTQKKKENPKSGTESVPEKAPSVEKTSRPIRAKSPGTLSLEAEELDYDEKMSEPETENKESDSPVKDGSKQEVTEKNDDKTHVENSDSEEDRNDWEDTIDEEVDPSQTRVSQETNENVVDLLTQESTSEKVESTSESLPKNDDVVDVDEQDEPEKVGSSHDSNSSNSSSSDSESQSDEEQPNTSKVEPEKDARMSEDDADVVTIDINESSDDGKLNEEEQNNQSWGQRWLRSKKVSKVMTSTKLGNKLRSKAKEKKLEERKALEEKERLEKLEEERLAEEERKRIEEEKKANEIPEDVLGTTKHFKDLKLLSKLREEREERAAKEAVRKTKKK